MKHKGFDYKFSAVKYYLNNNDSMDKTCNIFNCKKSSLKRWVHKYKDTKDLTQKNRKSISYKTTKPQVNTALKILDKNEQNTMNEMVFEMKQKYNDFNITPQH
jgi:transposase